MANAKPNLPLPLSLLTTFHSKHCNRQVLHTLSIHTHRQHTHTQKQNFLRIEHALHCSYYFPFPLNFRRAHNLD